MDIQVKARRESGSLLLEVSDKGPGIESQDRTNVNKGIGLSNTAERLHKLYGSGQSLNVGNAANGGLIVQITVPFHVA